MGEIVSIGCVTKADIDPQRVLQRAQEAGLQSAIVIGIDKDGEEYVAASQADAKDILWNLERAIARLHRMFD